MSDLHVGRYAPTPSGDLHLGNARTALLAWLWARASGGRVLLRVEDLDRPRTRPGAERRQRDELARLGLDWDGEVVHQSERGALYDEAIARLVAAGLAYPCFCSRADVRAAASAPHGPEGPRYPGTCSDLDPGEAAARIERGEQASLRFRVPAAAIEWRDAVHGPRREALPASAGDVVIRRADGVIAYQLAVVVDDAAQGVTHVLRGDDLLASTARQVAVREALGLGPPPVHAHVPLLLGADGERLAKRHGAIGVGELLDAGVRPERLVGWLAWSAGLLAEDRPVRPRELVSGFAVERLARGPFRVEVTPG